MDEIIKSLKARCAAAGTNITEVCREAGVSRSTIERWKQKPPKSLQILNSLEAKLAEHERGVCPGCMGPCGNCEERKSLCEECAHEKSLTAKTGMYDPGV